MNARGSFRRRHLTLSHGAGHASQAGLHLQFSISISISTQKILVHAGCRNPKDSKQVKLASTQGGRQLAVLLSALVLAAMCTLISTPLGLIS